MKKEIAFYQRAFEDAGFRRQEIDNLRHMKHGMLAVSICCGVLVLVAALCIGVSSGSWLETLMPSCLPLVFVASVWENHSTRLAALEAIDEKCNREAVPGS